MFGSTTRSSRQVMTARQTRSARSIVDRRNGTIPVAALLAVVLSWTFASDPVSAAMALQRLPADTLHAAAEYGGEIGAVATDGSRAYVAVHSRIHVFDPALPNDGRPLGTSMPLGAKIVSMAARRGRVLASAGMRLYVLDMFDPNDIVLRSTVSVGANFTVAWVGNEAWLAMGSQGLARVDVSDPARQSRPRAISLAEAEFQGPVKVVAVAEGGPGAAVLVQGNGSPDSPLSSFLWIDNRRSASPVSTLRVDVEAMYSILTARGDRAIIGPSPEFATARAYVLDYEANSASKQWPIATPDGERYLGDLSLDGRYLWRLDSEGTVRRQDLNSSGLEFTSRRVLENGINDRTQLLHIGDHVLVTDDLHVGGIKWGSRDNSPEAVRMAGPEEVGTGRVEDFLTASNGVWGIDSGHNVHYFDPASGRFQARFVGDGNDAAGEAVGPVRAFTAAGDRLTIAPRHSSGEVWEARHLGGGRIGQRRVRSAGENGVLTPLDATEDWTLWSIDGQPHVQRVDDNANGDVFRAVPPPPHPLVYTRLVLSSTHLWTQSSTFTAPDRFDAFALNEADPLRAVSTLTMPVAVFDAWDVDGATMALGQGSLLNFHHVLPDGSVRHIATLDFPSRILDVGLDGDRAWACWMQLRRGAEISVLDIARGNSPRDVGFFSTGDPTTRCNLQAAFGLGWNLSDGVLQALDLGPIPSSSSKWWLDPPGRIWLPWAGRRR